MKSFMEEYGKVIVVAIIIVALIVVACVFRDDGTKSLKGMLDNFLTKGDSANIGGTTVSDGTSGGSEDQCANLPTFTSGGKTYQVDYSTLTGDQTWQQALDGIAALNAANHNGHNDWKLFESETEAQDWWDTIGSADYAAGTKGSSSYKMSASGVFILWSSLPSSDQKANYWDCIDGWYYLTKTYTGSEVGWVAIRVV